MKRHILGSAIACLLLGSCASPKPEMPAAAAQAGTPAPDSERSASEGRAAAMAVAALERDLREQQQLHASERSDLMHRLEEMGQELSELKGRLQTKQVSALAALPVPPIAGAAGPAAPAVPAIPATPARPVRPVKAVNPAATPTPAQAAAAAAMAAAGITGPAATFGTSGSSGTSGATGASSAAAGKPGAAGMPVAKTPAKAPPIVGYSRFNRETIVIQDKGMIFRVMHDFARTEFHPSKALQQQLLQAARAGKQIEIRGRTDAATANDIDRDIAMRRALNARVFLANNGIHPRKMRINYLAAGDNVADNRTAEGRARNRRVEIETAGITADVLEDLAAVIRQDLQ